MLIRSLFLLAVMGNFSAIALANDNQELIQFDMSALSFVKERKIIDQKIQVTDDQYNLNKETSQDRYELSEERYQTLMLEKQFLAEQTPYKQYQRQKYLESSNRRANPEYFNQAPQISIPQIAPMPNQINFNQLTK